MDSVLVEATLGRAIGKCASAPGSAGIKLIVLPVDLLEPSPPLLYQGVQISLALIAMT